jgi:flagellar biosynthesis protein FlhG
MTKPFWKFDNSQIELPHKLPSPIFQIVSVCSGKGGVGKTMTSVNLCVLLAKAGWRITLMDGDLGLVSVKLMLPIAPTAHLGHWLADKCKFLSLNTSTPYGFNIISAPPNEFQLQELTDVQQQRFANLLNTIGATSDLLIIDNGAGINKNVMGLCRISHRMLLITTPDPTAMMSAYATIKAFTASLLPPSIGIIVNQARCSEEGLDTYHRLNEAITRYIGVDATWIGYIGVCRDFRNAIRTRTPPVVLRPKSPFSRSVNRTAARLSRWLVDENVPSQQVQAQAAIKKTLEELKRMEPVLQ